MAAATEDVPGGATQSQRELGRQIEIRDTADSVGTKQPRH
jgi:hypothetical protein